MRPQRLVQRKHHYAIIDEVDSVLVDDARTPLIISGPTPKGEIHQFDEYKPRVEKLYNAQTAARHQVAHRGQGTLNGRTTASQARNRKKAALRCSAHTAVCRRTMR